MTPAFLTAAPEGGPPAESPFTAPARSAGATVELRDGWLIATRFASADAEAETLRETVGWADASYLGKLELHVSAARAETLANVVGGPLGTAVGAAGAWWCAISPTRALVLCDNGRVGGLADELEGRVDIVDVSSAFCALRLAGPRARATIARFCSLDLRDDHAPVGAFRPGSVARTPGYVLRDAPDRFLVLVGAAYAEYLWTVVSDAGRRLGGTPVGSDAFLAVNDSIAVDRAHA